MREKTAAAARCGTESAALETAPLPQQGPLADQQHLLQLLLLLPQLLQRLVARAEAVLLGAERRQLAGEGVALSGDVRDAVREEEEEEEASSERGRSYV